MKEQFTNILKKAFEAGAKALKECVPTPQHFYPADLSGKQLGPGSIVKEGDCGGAYITGLHGRSEIVNFFKKHATKKYDNYTLDCGTYIRKGVYGGYELSAPTNTIYNGQSAERYEAFYKAYANVLNENDIKCSVRAYLT